MALQRSGLSDLLILLLVIVVMAEPGFAFKLEADNTISHFPPLIDCGPASAAPSSTFHANVLSLLGTLPSTAAAAPTGFATALSRGAGSTAHSRAASASAREGAAPPLPRLTGTASPACPPPPETSRRGGTWRAGCFLSFADTNATSPREDAFRGWFYNDDDDDATPSPTAALVRQCAGDRTAAECSQCLNKSARVLRELRRRRRLSRIHGESVVVVVGYGCVLRVVLVSPPPQWQINCELSVPLLSSSKTGADFTASA
ncbi:hypothetical protein EJB05_56839, partial [Eragrostis curvula]